MTCKSHRFQFVLVAAVAASVFLSLPAVADGKGAPAGQMCPGGSYVIGFDLDSNIICSGAVESVAPGSVETSTGANTGVDGKCVENCQSGGVETSSTDAVVASKSMTVNTGVTASIPELSISDVKPSAIVFGTREADITVIGTGFLPGSVIVFSGKKYSPSVNREGTRLVVTVPTRNLSIGAYAVKVSNGPGTEITRKKAIEIY